MRKLTDQDIAGIIGTTHSGYTIQRAKIKTGEFSDSDHYGIVLAQNAGGDWVTWQFHLEDAGISVYWGRYYMENRDAAIRDFEERN